MPGRNYTNKNLKLLYANIRGLRSNFLALQAASQKHDIIFLSETLTTDNKDQSEFLISGFESPKFIFRKHRSVRSQGMAVFTRKNSAIYHQSKYECKCHEVLCSKIYSRYHNIYLFAVYRNPTADDAIFDGLLDQVR